MPYAALGDGTEELADAGKGIAKEFSHRLCNLKDHIADLFDGIPYGAQQIQNTLKACLEIFYKAALADRRGPFLKLRRKVGKGLGHGLQFLRCHLTEQRGFHATKQAGNVPDAIQQVVHALQQYGSTILAQVIQRAVVHQLVYGLHYQLRILGGKLVGRLQIFDNGLYIAAVLLQIPQDGAGKSVQPAVPPPILIGVARPFHRNTLKVFFHIREHRLAAPSAEQIIALICRAADPFVKAIAHLGPHLGGLVHIANDVFKSGGPSGLSGFFQRVPHFGKCTHLGSRFHGFLSHLFHLLGHILGYAQRHQINGLKITAEYLQNCGDNIRIRPAGLKCLAEVLCGDFHLFASGGVVFVAFLAELAHGRRDVDEGLLQLHGAHVGVFNGAPVHNGQLAHAYGLAQVVHGHAGLLRSLAGQSGSVGNTFHGHYSVVQCNTVVGKFANVAGHVGEAVHRLVGIQVQLLQGGLYRLQMGLLRVGVAHLLPERGCGTGKDRLDGVHFELVLGPAGSYRVDGKGPDHGFAGAYQLAGQVKAQNLPDVSFQRFKAAAQRLKRECGRVECGLCHFANPSKRSAEQSGLFGGILQVKSLGGHLLDLLEAFANALKIQIALQLIQGLHALAGVSFKLVVVEVHRNDFLVNLSAHPDTTSFQASSAICLKIGRMAGLI